MRFKFTFLGLFLTLSSFAQSVQFISDINPGSDDAFDGGKVNKILATDDFMYFFADDGTHGVELWKSDGTDAGTHLIKDVNPGAADAFKTVISDIEDLIFEIGDKIIFMADDGIHGTELWTTDGTESGTTLLVDVYPGPTNGIGFSTAFDAYVMNDILFFQGRSEEFGRELWRSDGTVSGTYMIKNIRYLGADATPENFLEFNGLLYFGAEEGWIQGGQGEELFVTDGTEAGTNMVKNIEPYSAGSYPRGLTDAGDFFYLIVDDGLGAALWRSDGTEMGTTVIKDGFEAIAEDRMIAIGSKLFFTADNGTNGRELWTSDGTLAGTFMVRDIMVGTEGSWPNHFVALNDKAYFIAESENWGGDKFWVTDGTEAGTYELLDIAADYLTVFNDEIIFSGPTGSGWNKQMWRSDGTAAGTQVIADGPTELIQPKSYTVFQDKLFFLPSYSAYGRELWQYEPAGTTTFVSNFDSAENYDIAPNPADQFINLNFSNLDNKTLNIYNTIGSLVYSKANINSQTISIDVNDFKSGIYFSEIINDKNQKLTKRFIVK